MEEGKVCTGCNKFLPLDGFYRSKKGKLGRRSKCKPCFLRINEQAPTRTAEYYREYYASNRESVMRHKKKWLKNNRIDFGALEQV